MIKHGKVLEPCGAAFRFRRAALLESGLAFKTARPAAPKVAAMQTVSISPWNGMPH
jgi:hypothetical protein